MNPRHLAFILPTVALLYFTVGHYQNTGPPVVFIDHQSQTSPALSREAPVRHEALLSAHHAQALRGHAKGRPAIASDPRCGQGAHAETYPGLSLCQSDTADESWLLGTAITPITSLSASGPVELGGATTGSFFASADRIDLKINASVTGVWYLVEWDATSSKWFPHGASCAADTTVNSGLLLCRYVAKRGSNYWHVFKSSGTATVYIEQSYNGGGQSLGSIEPAAASGVPTTRQIATGTGLLGGGNLSADRTLTPDFGSGAGKVCQGNDARLSDARTPTAHAASHLSGGSDDLLSAPGSIGTGTAAPEIDVVVVRNPGILTLKGTAGTRIRDGADLTLFDCGVSAGSTCTVAGGVTVAMSNTKLSGLGPGSGAGDSIRWEQGGMLVSASNVSALTAATKYLSPPGGGGVNAAQVILGIVTRTSILRNLQASLGTAPGGADTVVYTVQKSSDRGATWADTTLTCTITGAAVTCSDTTHTPAVAAGDYLADKIVSSANTAANPAAGFEVL